MQDTATQTLKALEQRLQRVAFLLHGDALNDDDDNSSHAASAQSTSIVSRLQSLERSLQAVATQSSSAAELLRLHKQDAHLFDEPNDTEAFEDGPPDAALAALVLAHTPSYHTTAAQLTSLNDLPVPESTSSAALLALEPRIQKARQRQAQQERAIGEMREQSVALIGRWYEMGIVDMGDCWTEWEARLMDAERAVRRAEGRKKREEEAA